MDSPIGDRESPGASLDFRDRSSYSCEATGTSEPNRTARGTRLYDDAAIERLQLLKALVDSGEPIRKVAGLSDDALRLHGYRYALSYRFAFCLLQFLVDPLEDEAHVGEDGIDELLRRFVPGHQYSHRVPGHQRSRLRVTLCVDGAYDRVVHLVDVAV